jgi:hypothetical protein
MAGWRRWGSRPNEVTQKISAFYKLQRFWHYFQMTFSANYLGVFRYATSLDYEMISRS